MTESPALPRLTTELAQRLIAAERDCMVDWLRAMEAVVGNPFGIAIREFGQATALVCSQIPAEVYNRVIGMTAKEIGLAEADDFVRVYEQVWGAGGAIRVLLDQPRFRCYLAFVDGEAAGLGVLHIANRVGSMANGLTAPQFRGRGCQTALLYRRIHDAALAGCDLLVSQCNPGTDSQRNQLRTGFQIAGSKAWWLPMPA